MSLNGYIARQFSNPTGFGGRAVSFIMNRQNRPMYEETIRMLSPSDSDRILDMGCGNGYMLNVLARRYECASAGIDISASAIRAASRRNRRFMKDGKMSLSCQNMNSVSFADGSFSKAYTVNTVYFWEDLENTMVEIGRILEPKGIFVNTLYSNEALARFSHTQFGYRKYTKEQLTDAGVNAGFEVDAVPFLNGDAYCFVYKKTD
ncbi:MAG: methyltransferase domain-containing protein [Methanomassiliicoccaceae archaeon]|nr:methyltransferase domain-containing protein [Methanomassiliicoccaceae archaeon]